MNNMERWFKAMEWLHDVEVEPFNPHFSQEAYNNALLHKKVMIKARKILDKIPAPLLSEDQKDILEDRLFVMSCSILRLYSYSLDRNNCPRHRTDKGQELIGRVGLYGEPIPRNMKQALERFVNG